MNLDELDKHIKKLQSFDNDVKSINRQVENIKNGVQNVESGISDFSDSLYDSSEKLFNKSKNEYDIGASALVAGTGVVIDGMGKVFGFFGEMYADRKGNSLIKKLNVKKREVAFAKIDFANESLAWGNANIDKFMTILKKDLSISVENYEVDQELFYTSRQLSLEICYKCLFIIKLSNCLISTYENWINNNFFRITNKPEEKDILKELLYCNNGILGYSISKEKFIVEMNMQPIKANILLLLQNEKFINFLPLNSKELINATKKLSKTSLAKFSLNNNVAYQNILLLRRRKRINKFIACFLFFICFVLLYYWNIWGWWNFLVIPITIIVFILALIVYHKS